MAAKYQYHYIYILARWYLQPGADQFIRKTFIHVQVENTVYL